MMQYILPPNRIGGTHLQIPSQRYRARAILQVFKNCYDPENQPIRFNPGLNRMDAGCTNF